MKALIAILFFILILLQTFSSFVIRANYFLNKDYIANVLCINREKPKMHCNGKCYLAKKLREQEEQQSPVPKKEQFEIQLYCSILVYNLPNDQESTKTEHFDPAEKNPTSFPRSVFHPPSVS